MSEGAELVYNGLVHRNCVLFSVASFRLLTAFILILGAAHAADRVFPGDAPGIPLAASANPDTARTLNLLRQWPMVFAAFSLMQQLLPQRIEQVGMGVYLDTNT